MTELQTLQAEVLRPWLNLGGESLVREIGLWEDPDKLASTWGPLYRFFHTSIELEIQESEESEGNFTWDGLKYTRNWKGFNSQGDFLVARGEPGLLQLRGPISLVLQTFPQLYGLEATYFLAYRLYFRNNLYNNPKVNLVIDPEYAWSSVIPRNREGSFGDLIPIDPQIQRAIELGGMTSIHEDARSALALTLKIPPGKPPRENRVFQINTAERMQETGSWVEPVDMRDAQLRSRLLIRS